MVLAARVGAGVLTDAAVGDAVGAPLLADVVWEGLGVLGEVGGEVVVAHARGYEGVLVLRLAGVWNVVQDEELGFGRGAR